MAPRQTQSEADPGPGDRLDWDSDEGLIPLDRDEMAVAPGIDPHTGMQLPDYAPADDEEQD